MDKRAWILFSVATVAILAGLIFLSKQDKIDLSNIDEKKVITKEMLADTDSGLPDNLKGAKDSKVVLVEYGDYSCSGCAALDSKIQPVIKKYEKDVAFVFRHFPLTSMHPNSLIAATYAEAAGLQGKYWDMHEVLFENYQAWASLGVNEREQKLQEYAKEVKLDIEKLKKDISDERISKKIDFDMQLGRKISVNATPTVFLNGEKLGEEVSDMNKLEDKLDKVIKENK